jgi:hypothetical protein
VAQIPRRHADSVGTTTCGPEAVRQVVKLASSWEYGRLRCCSLPRKANIQAGSVQQQPPRSFISQRKPLGCCTFEALRLTSREGSELAEHRWPWVTAAHAVMRLQERVLPMHDRTGPLPTRHACLTKRPNDHVSRLNPRPWK